MADNTQNLVLEHLRYIRAAVDQHSEEFTEVKARLSSLERLVAGVFVDKADQNDRYDRLAKRLERVEKRLELIEP